MGKFRGPLTAEQALQGIDCCLENAEALIEDGQLLLDNGRAARCTALCLVAAEELGKIPMLGGCARNEDDLRQWRGFWRRFRSHLSKLSMADVVFASQVIEPNLAAIGRGQFGAEYGHVAGLREMSLYVDCVDGSFVVPGNAPAVAAVASSLLTELRQALEFHRSVREHLTPDFMKTVHIPDSWREFLKGAPRSKDRRPVCGGNQDVLALLRDYRKKAREIGRKSRQEWEDRERGSATPGE